MFKRKKKDRHLLTLIVLELFFMALPSADTIAPLMCLLRSFDTDEEILAGSFLRPEYADRSRRFGSQLSWLPEY